MNWLLDTDVICQPAKRHGDARVVAWLHKERDRSLSNLDSTAAAGRAANDRASASTSSGVLYFASDISCMISVRGA